MLLQFSTQHSSRVQRTTRKPDDVVYCLDRHDKTTTEEQDDALSGPRKSGTCSPHTCEATEVYKRSGKTQVPSVREPSSAPFIQLLLLASAEESNAAERAKAKVTLC